MRILLHGWGSRGDVQPMLALAMGLRDAGHDAALAATTDFGPWIESNGIAYEESALDLGELTRTPLGRRWLGGQYSSTRESLSLTSQAMRIGAGAIGAKIVRTTDAYDAVVTTPLLSDAMVSMSVRRGRRVACAFLQPGLATRNGESYIYAPRPGPSPLNQLAGLGVTLGVRPVVTPVGDAVRSLAGLPRLGLPRYARGALRMPYLLATSPLVTPPQPDWPAPVEVTGFWRMPPHAQAALDPVLSSFLAAGEPPVYVGFGSMPSHASAETSRLVRAAVRLAGVRAVVLRGAADLAIEDDPRILMIDGAPHEALFPRLAAVVHHGGAGTTSAALHAGVPQAVVPHMGDQPYWARRTHELGVGARPELRRHLTGGRLARMIAEAREPRRVIAAATLGERLRAEDGVVRGVTHLERLWG